MRLQVKVPQASGDGGREQGQAAERGRDAKVYGVVPVQSPVGQGGLCLCPAHAAVVLLAAVNRQSGVRDVALPGRQARPLLGKVGKQEPNSESGQAAGQTLEDEEPAPCRQTVHAVHVTYCVGESTAESARQGGAGEDECDADGALLGLVPKGQVVDQAGEQAGLEHAEQEPNAGDLRKGGGAAQADGDGAPAEHQKRNPSRRAQLFEQDVGGNFENGVGDEEH